MSNEYVFLRHALTKIDSSKPAEQWELAEEGIRNITELVQSGVFDDIDIIVASAEMKAFQTAHFVKERIEKEISQMIEFNELNRGFSYLSSKEEYEKKVSIALLNIDKSINDWESAKSTLDRFLQGIENLNKKFSNKKILVVCHGINLSLYFAHLLKIPEKQLFARWKNLEFCAWGIVKKKEVVRDIVY